MSRYFTFSGDPNYERGGQRGCYIYMNLARIVSSRLRKADEDIVKLTTILSIVLKGRCLNIFDSSRPAVTIFH